MRDKLALRPHPFDPTTAQVLRGVNSVVGTNVLFTPLRTASMLLVQNFYLY
jgi:hypothetical protein